MQRESSFLAAVAAFLAVACCAAAGAKGAGGGADVSRLASLSLEELADVEISSVSKRVEKRSAAAAAIHVITSEDIRRSAAVTLADVLRMAPGVHVANLDATRRSVSIRGFGGRYANALLVLVDGRSIYSPLFSGTEWETEDMMLENIERIEIIRGPGGTLWGANAVNGVINIVTKNAADTQGGLVSLGGGTEIRGLGAARYGGTAGEHGHYRLHLRYLKRDESILPGPERAGDDAINVRGGVRFDWDWGSDQLMLSGDLYGADLGQVFEVPIQEEPHSEVRRAAAYNSGGHLLGRWMRSYETGAQLRVQAYYDRSETNAGGFEEDRDAIDLEAQYRMAPAGRHEFMWGAGFRYYDDRTTEGSSIAFDPPDNRAWLFSAFVQDRIALVGDKLTLTLGTKLEHNDFTGIEIQPSARLAWTPNETHTLWAAVSRAVRTPSISEDAGRSSGSAFPGGLITLVGNRDYKAEDLLALETGYRFTGTENFQLDLALFYNRYADLRTLEFGLPFFELEPFPPHLVLPIIPRNNMSGVTYGAEFSVNWAPLDWWRLRVHYSLLEMHLDPDPEGPDPLSGAIEDASPEQQVFLGSYMDLGTQVKLDLVLRYVDRLPALEIEDYLTLDARLAWKPREDLEVAVIGHDLLHAVHQEYDASTVNFLPTKVQRGIYGKVTWQF